MPKRTIGTDVLTAARERIAWTFDTFDRISLSFSGGKDSTVMMHLVMEEAIARSRSVSVLFIDWECQFSETIKHVRKMFELYAENIDPYWVALPIKTVNGCSQYEPEWTAWDPNKRNLWTREPDPMSITDKSFFPFYYDGITFEEFVTLFNAWFANGGLSACFVGLRADESLNRFRAMAMEKEKMHDKPYTTRVVHDAWNVYPIYDWKAEDDWKYLAKFGKCYNVLYDRMYQAGMKLSQMRVDEPFGDVQRKGLWLYQIIEPQLWSKLVARVEGVNSTALYVKKGGNMTGTGSLVLPQGHTWESFSMSILNSMPPKTALHYKNKIAVYLKFYRDRGYPDGIPDAADDKLERAAKVPAWRQICRALLRNDYWCTGLGFSPTKSSAYGKYLDLMKRRRSKWNIFNQIEDEN